MPLHDLGKRDFVPGSKEAVALVTELRSDCQIQKMHCLSSLDSQIVSASFRKGVAPAHSDIKSRAVAHILRYGSSSSKI